VVIGNGAEVVYNAARVIVNGTVVVDATAFVVKVGIVFDDTCVGYAAAEFIVDRAARVHYGTCTYDDGAAVGNSTSDG